MRTSLTHSPLAGCRTPEQLLRATGRPTCAMIVTWSGIDGSVSSVQEIGFLDDQEAIVAEAYRKAAEDGWTPKRWWKFWRWDDTPNPKDPLP